MSNILLISTNSEWAAKLGEQVADRGYTVLQYPSIDDAIAAAAHPPAMILLDLGADAAPTTSAIEQLRAATATSAVPLLTLSTNATASPQADLHLHAPCDEAELLASVEALLRVSPTISSLRQQHAELRARTEAAESRQQSLEAYERKKDEFISFVSHELKNPMASIKGYADLMRRRLSKTPDDPNIKGLDIISQQVLRMTGLLDQLLDFSRISMDRLQLHPAPINASDLVQRAAAALNARTDQHEIAIELAETPLIIAVDSVRMGQALSNLLQNAVKFSPEGGTITIRTAQAAAEASEHAPAALISVSDEGTGIPAEQQPFIFEQFSRVNGEPDGNSGMGLGLFIANAIVKRHGGRISVESQEGHGSTFSIRLPLATM